MNAILSAAVLPFIVGLPSLALASAFVDDGDIAIRLNVDDADGAPIDGGEAGAGEEASRH